MSNLTGKVVLNVVFAAIAAIAAIIYSGKVEWFLQKVNEAVHQKTGCNPIPSIDNVTVHYFNSRGRAESIRMLLHDHLVAHEETRFTKHVWKEAKDAGLDEIYAFGQVPYIHTNRGVELVQSHAILHYLGRSVGLDCDCKDLHYCEMVSLGVEDFRQKVSRIMYSPDFSYDTRDEYVNGVMKLWLRHFENILQRAKQCENCRYFAGSRVTWIDYLVFDVLESHDNFINATEHSGSAPKAFFLDAYPALREFYNDFAKRPMLKDYLTSAERIPFSLPKEPKAAKATKAEKEEKKQKTVK